MNGNNWCKSETFGPVLGDCIWWYTECDDEGLRAAVLTDRNEQVLAAARGHLQTRSRQFQVRQIFEFRRDARVYSVTFSIDFLFIFTIRRHIIWLSCLKTCSDRLTAIPIAYFTDAHLFFCSTTCATDLPFASFLGFNHISHGPS